VAVNLNKVEIILYFATIYLSLAMPQALSSVICYKTVKIPATRYSYVLIPRVEGAGPIGMQVWKFRESSIVCVDHITSECFVYDRWASFCRT